MTTNTGHSGSDSDLTDAPLVSFEVRCLLPLAAYSPIIISRADPPVFQAKPHHAGGILTPSGKPEPFNDHTFAQEVWQMLYGAYSQHRIKHLEYQTSLWIVMHGVQMRIGCTDVPKTYIEGITTTEAAPSDLYVRRTYEYAPGDDGEYMQQKRVFRGELEACLHLQLTGIRHGCPKLSSFYENR